MKMNVVIDGQTYEVDVQDINARPVIAVVDGERFEVWPETASNVPAISAAPAATMPGPAPMKRACCSCGPNRQ